MKVFGYTRVSTADQAAEGVSLDAQTDRINAWCRLKGDSFELAEVFVDAGLSGKRSDNRPGLQAALESVCEARGILVVYSLSRLARSVPDAYSILQRLDKSGAHLVSLTEQMDTTTAMGRMFFGFISLLAAFERDLISERTKTALSYKRSKSERIGQIPYGSRLDPDGKTLDFDPAELLVITRILDLAFEGESLRGIASALNRDGVPAKNGGPWTHTSIYRILNRPSSYADAKK